MDIFMKDQQDGWIKYVSYNGDARTLQTVLRIRL